LRPKGPRYLRAPTATAISSIASKGGWIYDLGEEVKPKVDIIWELRADI
jgi:hypothetical protein